MELHRTIARSCEITAFLCLTAFAARTTSAQVGGRVTDESGRPVAGALVVIAELDCGASSDADGGFRLGTIPPGRYSLTARRIGYTPRAHGEPGSPPCCAAAPGCAT